MFLQIDVSPPITLPSWKTWMKRLIR